MDTKSLLFNNRTEHLKKILKQMEKTEKSFLADVQLVKDWLQGQAHLPEIPDENMIENFLFMNKFSIENTKQKLDMYYTIRSLIPEIYKDKNPCLPHMVKTANLIYNIPLPKVTEEGYRVIVIKIINDNPDDFDVYNFFAHSFNVIEIRVHEDVAVGDVIIYDCGNLKMGHVLKFTPVSIKKVLTVLEKVLSNRLKRVHFINFPPFIDKLLSVVKQVMKPKLARRFYLHKGNEELVEFISRKILPEDYGGEEISLRELSELWKQKLVEYQDRFNVLDKLTVLENLRPTPLNNDDILGYYGNFRMLDMD